MLALHSSSLEDACVDYTIIERAPTSRSRRRRLAPVNALRFRQAAAFLADRIALYRKSGLQMSASQRADRDPLKQENETLHPSEGRNRC